jgi:hypothetical protein
MVVIFKVVNAPTKKLSPLEKIPKTGGINPFQIKKKAYFRQVDNLTIGLKAPSI